VYSPNKTSGTGYRMNDIRHPKIIKLLPDYLNDLNAMHEAEKQMKLSDLTSYREMLFDWLKSDCVCASASTKAEAFLRTIGKWEDEA
jgi:hypothetical protein